MSKPIWSLVDYESIEDMIQILEFGLTKYDQDFWKDNYDRTSYLNSMQRHLAEMFKGNEFDQESGLPHAAHLMARCMFYLHHLRKENQ